LVSDPSTLPSNISVVQYFFETYKYFIKSRNYEEATKIKTELADLIENNIDTTARDIMFFGKKLQEDKRFLESMLIFDAASTLSKKIKIPAEKMNIIRFCVLGMMWTSKAMIEEDPAMKVVVKDYVIPLMHYKLHDIESTSSVSEQYKCLHVSWILQHIEWSQILKEVIGRSVEGK